MADKPHRYVSLKDLARELGVSISTVSRALKDHPNISPEIKKKVRKLADQWNYSPNPLAMGLLRQNTRTIGVIVPDLVTHFFSSVISGIEAFARKNGYYIIISSSYESVQKEKECIENLMNSRVEGLIVSISYQTEDHSHFDDLVRKGVPIVFFDRVCLADKVPTVVADNREAARKSIEHFIKYGYKRIAHIAGPSFLNISAEREEGYRQALHTNGIEFREELLIPCEMNPECATRTTQQLLSLPDPPDAIFCINDTVAFAAMKEVRKRGLNIPDDVGIIGFTDDYHATVVTPPLTSITHPTYEMGRTSARLFIDLLNGNKEPRQVLVTTDLVIRESSQRKSMNS
jgi:LacI family transcriptional regulator